MNGSVSCAVKRRPTLAANNPFSIYHPAVAFVYLACCIVFSMVMMHPVYAALSFMGAFACACLVQGVRKAARTLTLALVLALTVAVANVIFVTSGSTELFRVGLRVFSLESLIYGMTAGAMLASVFLWFFSYAAYMGSDNSLALFGNLFPMVTLMVSQVLRLMPQFVKRGRDIAAVQNAASSAAARTRWEVVADRLRVISVLTGWGMEDSLVRGDAMRARGYACGVRRTTYKRLRIGQGDVVAIVIVCVFALVNATLAARTLAGFSFYPTVVGATSWWLYAPYTAFVSIPLFVAIGEWWRWR